MIYIPLKFEIWKYPFRQKDFVVKSKIETQILNSLNKIQEYAKMSAGLVGKTQKGSVTGGHVMSMLLFTLYPAEQKQSVDHNKNSF